jgi:superfamily I DNA/RNA helicase
VPLTFIGDHKQLGPVCEMNDENLGLPENNSALVWKKSALFIDDLFIADSGVTLINEWQKFQEPQLRRFTKTQLNKTFRFGQNLADILSECVYEGMNFISAAPHEDLKIICLDAVPNAAPTKPRQNRSEAEAIEMYLRELPEQQEEAEETYAALAPYKNQVGLLTRQIDEARRQERIMTVHKSQGREWDTVILSVVDGHFNKPWFTDTINPQSGGLHVMNTAVSRAKRRLILVCDVQFWQNHPDAKRQLISRLIAGI